MGAGLGHVYTALSNELVWLHLKWANYLALFGTSSERVALLNQTAGSFFHAIQDVMWNDLLLGLARLSDPPRTAGRDNLSVTCLPDLVTGTPIQATVASQVALVLEHVQFARDWRNRHLAHRDLARAIAGREAEPLSLASTASIRLCLGDLVDLLNMVDNHYLDSTMFYDMDHVPGGPESLLRVLGHGIRAQELYLEELRTGTATSEEVQAHRRAV